MTDFSHEPVMRIQSNRAKLVLTWAKAIAIVVAAFGAAYAGILTRGEPKANRAYEELAKAFNELRTQAAEDRAYMRGFLDGQKQAPVVVASTPIVKPDHKKCERDVFKITPVIKPAFKPAPPAPSFLKRAPAQPLPPYIDQLPKK
jgi:hypothetical protein